MNLSRKDAKKIEPINWGISSPNQIRLLWGENNAEINENVKSALMKEMDRVNMYPDPTKKELKEKLAKYNNVDSENIVIGNGSDEIIEAIAKTFIESGDEIVIPVPSFPTYSNVSLLMGGIVKEILLDEKFNLNIDNLIGNINEKTKVIFIANPNNPTGNMLVSKRDIERIMSNFEGLLVIDECYFEIAGETVMDLVKKYENLLVLRSFSKCFALAGLRIGYAVGSNAIISEIEKVTNTLQPFNVNRFALAAASAAIDYKDDSVNRWLGMKRDFVGRLKLIDNIQIIDTKTTFILLDLSNFKMSGLDFKKKMAEKNILVKDCGIYKNFRSNYAYLGIPKRNEFDYVIKSIKEVLS